MRGAAQDSGLGRRVVLWLSAVASLLVLTVTLVFAVDAAGDLARKDACHLGLEFEVTFARTLDTSWFPPTATCEYTVLGRREVERETRWRIYFPLIPLVGFVASVAALATTRRSTEAS